MESAGKRLNICGIKLAQKKPPQAVLYPTFHPAARKPCRGAPLCALPRRRPTAIFPLLCAFRVENKRLVLGLANSANGSPVATVAAVHVAIARIEVEAPRVAGTARVERTRPVAAVGTGIVETTTVAAASSGQKN